MKLISKTPSNLSKAENETLKYLKKTRPQGEREISPVISLNQRYVFFPIGKVANSSIKSLLFRCELEGTRRVVPGDQYVHDPIRSPLVLPYQLPEETFAQILADKSFRKVAIVRNPYDRLLSCYLDRLQKEHTQAYIKTIKLLRLRNGDEIDFNAFVASLEKQLLADVHWRPQWVELGGGKIEFDYVGRFENLQKDVGRIVAMLYPRSRNADLGFQSPTKTNAGEARKQFYGPNELEIVRRLYAEDFKQFGYEI